MKFLFQKMVLAVCFFMAVGECSVAFAAAKVNLVWQPSIERDNSLAQLPKLPGVNVVSPSYFAIVKANGLLASTAELAYVQGAQQKGYQVWPLITNSFDPELTHELLMDPAARKYVVQQLLFYAERYGFDGINIDFENVYDEDSTQLTVFVAEIAEALRSEGKVISIDVTMPSGTPNWSACYDRPALAQAVDYVMLMAYDEHWRSSKTSGSVASIGWVENGLIETLQMIPADKLVLGLPLYMRLWEEKEGRTVRARTLTMAGADALIAEKRLQPQWLESQGQYYFEYQEGDSFFRVWQEEVHSIEKKAALIEKYHLAGAASWRKGFEVPAVWPLLERVLVDTGIAAK